MPEEETIERAREDEREGKSPSTQAGEFVREEMEHIREGEHGARSPEQAIAIGLSKARRAGVKLPPPKRGSQRTKRQAKRDLAKGRSGRRKKPSLKRSRATKRALKRESRQLSIKAGIVETREARGGPTLCTLAFGRREESSAHTKASPLRCSVVREEEKVVRLVALHDLPICKHPPNHVLGDFRVVIQWLRSSFRSALAMSCDCHDRLGLITRGA